MGDDSSSALKLYRGITIAGVSGVTFGYAQIDASWTQLHPLLAVTFYIYVGFTVLGLLAGLVHESARRQTGMIVLIAGYILSLYFGQRIIASNLSPEEAATGPLLVVLVAAMFHTVRLTAAWVTGATAIVLAHAATLTAPEANATNYALNVLISAVVAGLLKTSLIRNKDRRTHDQALISSVFESATDGMLYAEERLSQLMGINQRMLALFETEDPQMVSRLCQDAYQTNASGDPEALRSALLATEGGEVLQQDIEFKTAKGNAFFGRIALSPLKGMAKPTTLIRVTDITDLHAKQLELEAANEQAEAAIKVRSQFLANMSHEIRTPMNGVIGMTSLLLNTPVNEEQASYIETIRSSGEALLIIINEILDFSKIEAGQVELEHQDFDLEQCAAEALDIISPIAANKSLEVIFDFPPEHSSRLRGDVQRLRQVLVNLLSNAVKFTEEGEVTLRVEVDADANGPAVPLTPCTVRFTVTDTGIGIPPQKRESLFDAFTQADASTTRRYGGTGLGLSISRSLVQLMGGEIRVTSQVGSGSAFSFDVRVERHENENVQPVATLTNRRVMAVDDNETNRRVLEGLLAWTEVHSNIYPTPETLLRALENEVPDLIVTDMAMPDMDGAQLAVAVRERLDNPPPIILLTSLDGSGVDREIFSAVLRKPTRPSELYNAMRNAISGTSTSATRSIESPSARLSLNDRCVLLAEDNLVNQKVAQQMLKKLGVRTDIAANGREAIQMMQQRSYAIVLMDVQMPEIDGLEATRLIRLDESGPQPYIVAMTANARAEDRNECLDAGMDDFVSKPIRLQDVRKALQRAVAARPDA